MTLSITIKNVTASSMTLSITIKNFDSLQYDSQHDIM
jgi:hypothetical protein